MRVSVLSRGPGWLAAVTVTLLTLGLVLGDLANASFRAWWAARPLTTDTVSGLLVLLITVLVVDQVVGLRQLRNRSRTIGAQSAILVAQADRTVQAVTAVLNGTGEHDAATDEVRTYAMMLLVGAPVLIEAKVSRDFLEQAQSLAGELARLIAQASKSAGAASLTTTRLDEANRRLRAAAAPLLQVLNLDELIATGADDPG